MEPVTSIVSAIFKVLQEIAKAEREARRNLTRCRDLARRAQVVSNVLRDAKAHGGGAAAATRRIILCRLREALDDALKLVESCGRRDDDSRRGRLASWFSARLNGSTRAARFDDVDKRINNCLVELSAASGASIEKKIDRLAVAGHDRHPRTNKQKETKAGNAPQNGATGKGGQNGGKGGKQRRRGKKKAAAAAASRPPPPSVTHAGVPFHPNGHRCTVHHHHYSVEEDLTSCSVM